MGKLSPKWRYRNILNAFCSTQAWHQSPMFSSLGARPLKWLSVLINPYEYIYRFSFLSFMIANPKSSKWYNRDRFVLSNG